MDRPDNLFENFNIIKIILYFESFIFIYLIIDWSHDIILNILSFLIGNFKYSNLIFKWQLSSQLCTVLIWISQ